jgi:IPT/TIG domain
LGSAVYGLRQGFLANRNRATLLPLCFTVTSGTGAPTITNFSPTSGIPGTQVTVTGTGFDPTPINDVVKVNLSPASISAATASSLGITVPNSVASGHISVRTKAGTATSTQDFYVPFGTHLVTDIGFTGRMTANSTQTVSIGTAGKIGLMLFDGVPGQSISITVGSSTFGSCNLFLIDPLGHQLGSAGCGRVDTYPPRLLRIAVPTPSE